MVLVPLFDIVYEAFRRGGAVLFEGGFLTDVPPNACSQLSCQTVGIGPDIVGSVPVIGLASAIAVPIGVLAAIFAAEYRTRGVGRAVSFVADVLTGVPSITLGAFVYSFFVLYDPRLVVSALTGGLALSLVMVPIVTRSTEEALRLVPSSTREAALALGISKWKTSLRIVLLTSLPGTATGVLLAVSRAAGEAAPLLFTAGGSLVYFQGWDRPTAALPLLIYQFALSPYANQQKVAWGATLFLLLLVLSVNVGSRAVIRRLKRRMGHN